MAGTSAKSRKKTDKAAANNANSQKSAAAPDSSKNDDALSVDDQLNRAEAAVERNHATMLELHQQWRTQLLRMSYLVMIVTLHIAQTPSGACIKDIKQWNKLHSDSNDSSMSIPGLDAIQLVLHDSTVEIVSILCAVFLVQCLRLPMSGNDFSTIPYRLSCVVLPMIVSLHFQRKKQQHQSIGDETENYSLMSCVATTDAYRTSSPPSTITLEDLRGLDNAEPITRHFPVILVFHTIVSLSLWFMQYQNQQHDKNLEMVQKLKRDLADARKGKLDRKKR